MNMPDVSLVIPVRDEAGNIGPLIEEIRRTLDAAGLGWELFVVDDGSTDASWQEIEAAASADPRVKGIRQPRGLGKSAALAAGFGRCRSTKIAMLDGDGQDNPEELPGMIALLEARGVDLVNGWKTPRLDPWHKTWPSRVFNGLVGACSGLRLHDHNCGLKVMRADVARRLVLDEGMHRFIPVLAAAEGFRVVERPVHHRPRIRGQSKYGMTRFFAGLRDLLRVLPRVRGRGLLDSSRRPEPRSRLRHGIYAILATLAAAAVLGRIGAVTSVDRLALEKRLVADAIARATAAGLPADPVQIRARIEQDKRLMRPFLSANDRSRWLAIRSLVERGTFAIDEIVGEPGWDTVDAVAHADESGRLRLYSSKPPLLSVLCAGPYWLLSRLTGWTLADHPFEMGRMLMVLYGILPLLVMISMACRLIDAIGTTDWGRIWSAALISCGTLLTTFAVVLTNHLPAAACAATSGWLVYRIRCQGLRSRAAFFLAGVSAGLTAAFELPALAWCVAVLVMLALADVRRTMLAALPAMALVAAAALGTNWIAHGTPLPPYAHRETTGGSGTNWYDYSLTLPDGRVISSYWKNPQGVDQGEPSASLYAWHVIAGHHGILSLTPAWLLVLPGLLRMLRSPERGRREMAIAIASVSLIVIGFYLLRPQLDRNYGGMTCGFRWVFWLAPLWVAAAVPAVDRLATGGIGRGFALAVLGLSVVSVAYPTWNPWTAPWIQQWLTYAGGLPPS